MRKRRLVNVESSKLRHLELLGLGTLNGPAIKFTSVFSAELLAFTRQQRLVSQTSHGSPTNTTLKVHIRVTVLNTRNCTNVDTKTQRIPRR